MPGSLRKTPQRGPLIAQLAKTSTLLPPPSPGPTGDTKATGSSRGERKFLLDCISDLDSPDPSHQKYMIHSIPTTGIAS